jgi:flagellar basal-body rod protein FlgF
MEVSLYSAAAAMNATERWQDLVTENMSSASIPGARQREISFSSVPAGLSSGYGPGSQFVIPATTYSVSFQQGELKATGDNLSFALQGPGFFAVQLPNGSKAYTRDGEFHLDAKGTLVNKQNHPVMTDSGPLQFDMNNKAPIHVATDGEVSQGNDIKGKISVTDFKNMKAVSTLGTSLVIPNGPEAKPEPAADTIVQQGAVEGSNTSPTLAMATLVTAMRMFETNQKVMQMQDERLGKSITELSGTN